MAQLPRRRFDRTSKRPASGRVRFVAAVCIAAVFLACVVPVAAGLFSAVLVPLPPLFGTVVCVDVPTPVAVSPEPFPPLALLASRAPPLA